METFQLIAHPWWVSLAAIVPFFLYGMWRRQGGLAIEKRALLWTLLFAIAFGYLEAAAVIHLRAAAGLLPGYEGTLVDVQRRTAEYYEITGKPVGEIPAMIPQSLAVVEFLRNAASMAMLFVVAMLVGQRMRERAAAFFWMAAAWDIAYYIFLWFTIRWPVSLFSPDILFLIPVPWISQVWFPMLVSALTMAAVIAARRPVAQVNI